MIRQCVILAPRDASLLYWQLRELARFGIDDVLLVGAGAVDGLPRPMRVTRVEMLSPDLVQPRFLLCRGDMLFAANLAPLVVWEAGDELGWRLRQSGGDAAIYAFDRAVLERGAIDFAAPWRTVAVDGDIFAAGDPGIGRLVRPALFLDRDGVLNIDHGYIGTRERFEWTEGALDAVRLATERGWHVFVVTNQSGIARGYYSEAQNRALLDWMTDEVRRAGGTIDDIRYCPHHPDATVADYRLACDCRKPAPGMLLDLIKCWHLDPGRAVLIGDSPTDLEAASAAGIKSHHFPGGNLFSFVSPLLSKFGTAPNG